MRSLALTTLCLLFAACTQLPEFRGSAEAQRAPFPTLLPLNAFFGAETGPARDGFDPMAGVEARAARLRAGAAILRAAVASPDDLDAIRARLAR